MCTREYHKLYRYGSTACCMVAADAGEIERLTVDPMIASSRVRVCSQRHDTGTAVLSVLYENNHYMTTTVILYSCTL